MLRLSIFVLLFCLLAAAAAQDAEEEEEYLGRLRVREHPVSGRVYRRGEKTFVIRVREHTSLPDGETD